MADCASRGLLPSELVSHTLYWDGITLLVAPLSTWPLRVRPVPIDQLPELKQEKPAVLVLQEPEWYSRFSSYLHMLRVVVQIRRFITRCRRQPVSELYISRYELDEAALIIALFSQCSYFSKTHLELQQGRPVSDRLVARLRPFLDDGGLIRVGGRLSKSDLGHDQKHPVLVAKLSHFSLLLVCHWHDITGHSGPRVLTALIGLFYNVLCLNLTNGILEYS